MIRYNDSKLAFSTALPTVSSYSPKILEISISHYTPNDFFTLVHVLVGCQGDKVFSMVEARNGLRRVNNLRNLDRAQIAG